MLSHSVIGHVLHKNMDLAGIEPCTICPVFKPKTEHSRTKKRFLGDFWEKSQEFLKKERKNGQEKHNF